jgi:YD repeat-containing protein
MLVRASVEPQSKYLDRHTSVWKRTAIVVALSVLSGSFASEVLAQNAPQPPNIQNVTTFLPRTRANAVSPLVSAGTATATQAPRALAAAPSAPTPPEIVELARALKNDPDLIYGYVANNIRTLPQYGSLKGPVGTLLDGAGTQFDQAELMVSLLTQAGFSANLVSGQISLTAAQATSWLGTDNTMNSVGVVLGDGGFSGFFEGILNNTFSEVVLDWIWVQVQINGVTYVFDPATKQYNRIADVSQATLRSELGYSQSTFISDAEDTAVFGTNGTTIQTVDRTKVRNDLNTYANNLVNAVKTANPTGTTTADVLGGIKNIVPLPLNTHQRITQLPNQTNTPSVITNTAPFRTTLTVNLPGVTQPPVLNSSDIYGHRLSLVFDASCNPTVQLDGSVVESGSTATCGNSTYNFSVSIAHPYPTDFANQPNSANPTPPALSVTANTNTFYVIGTGWGQVGPGMIEKHRKLLRQNIAANPNNPGAESVLGESLAMLGYTWLAENARVQQLTDQFDQTSTVYQHAVGIVGEKPVAGAQGPFVDLPINELSLAQRVGRPSGGGTTPQEAAAFFTDAGTSSILESGSIEQIQPGAIAASTVKLVDTVSQTSGTQSEIFDINNGAISGDDCPHYASAIRPLMAPPSMGGTGNYNSGDISRIDSLVGYSTSTNSCSLSGAGHNLRVIAPLNGQITVNQYTGVGFFQVTQDGSSIGAIITGGLSGGEPASSIPIAITASDPITVTIPADSTPVIPLVPAANIASVTGGDPLNLVSGSYLYSHDDLSIGQGAFPYSLGFTRYYDSGSYLRNGPLGLGWTHNFAITAKTDSDGFEGMGSNSPVSAAGAIAALFVSQDILNHVTDTSKALDRMVIASLVERWVMDELTNNVVTVAQPNNTERFTKLYDGHSYNPPLGSATVMTQNPDTSYKYQASNGVTLNFNTDGTIASYVTAGGATVTFSYSNGNLATVSNSTGRQLNFTYSGSLLQSVSDNSGTGRSVSYGYDSNNHLTSFTDPLSQQTTFAYDTSGVNDTQGHLTKIFYPSHPANAFVTNTYDSLGRVAQQANANGNVTQGFFAGSRTEIDDPAGNRHAMYFDSRGKVTADIQDFGDNTHLNIITLSQYDSQERVTLTTLPELNTIAYTYDSFSNPLTIAQHAKPVFNVPDLVQNFTYVSPVAAQPNFSEVHTAQDPNGNVTTYNYDSATGNLTELDQPAVPKPGLGNVVPKQFFTYTSIGQILNTTDAEGRQTCNTYDTTHSDFLTKVIQDCGTGRLNLTETFQPDAVGNIFEIIDADHNGKTYKYDILRRMTEVDGAVAGFRIGYTYDPDGRVTAYIINVNDTVTEPTTVTYTPSGKVQTITDPANFVATYTYDADDRASTFTDAQNRQQTFTYDALSRLFQISDTTANGGIGVLETHAYTPNGKDLSFKNSRNAVTQYARDGFDRLARTTYPDPSNSFETFAYDSNGNVLTKTTRSGLTIGFTYDALNRFQTKTPQGEVAGMVTYGYDLSGRLLQASDASNSNPYAIGYDTAGRAISYTDQLGRVVTLTRDAVGNKTSVTWPVGTNGTNGRHAVSYTYDANNRMISVRVRPGTS